MAGSTITETSVTGKQLCKSTPNTNYKLTYRLQNKCFNNNTKDSSVYEETLPKEPKFLVPLRKWEMKMGFVTPIRWINAIIITILHILTASATIFYILQSWVPKWQTYVFGWLVGQIAGFGVTAGAHRYWTHRSYKATLPLRIILIFCYSVAGQNDLYNWVRDHRVHHKFSETSADPHDARRGFFFSHVGWLMMKKHPDVIREGSKIDMNDIVNDRLVQFHRKYFMIFKILFCFLLPTLVPVYMWDETWTSAILSQTLIRYICSLNFTWSVNSFAHIWGNKPYDRHIMPAENWAVSVVALGEGWHNYHHTFPWDYKASELAYINVTTYILNLFAKIGWAYDLKQASPSLIKSVIDKKGIISDHH